MVLEFGLLGGKGMFEPRSAEDGEVDKYEGGRKVPSADTDTTYTDTDFDHNQLTNFDVDKHKAWAASIAENIHADNYTDTGDTTYTAGTGVDLTGTQFSSDDSNINHDALNNFDVDKHKAWANSIAENVHSDNYTNSQYTSGDFTHDDLGGFDVNKHREWAASIAQNVHANNYTNTLPTKEFWSSAAGADQAVYAGNFVVLAGTWDSGVEAGISFKVPHNFTSLTSAEIIVWEDTGTYGTANLDIGANYGAAGENYNIHAETDRASTYNLVQNKFTAIDVSGILTSLAANDYVSIRISNEDGGTFDLWVVGLRLRYT